MRIPLLIGRSTRLPSKLHKILQQQFFTFVRRQRSSSERESLLPALLALAPAGVCSVK